VRAAPADAPPPFVIECLADLFCRRSEVPAGNDRFRVRRRGGHRHEELAGVRHDAGDGRTPLTAAIVADLESVVTGTGAVGALIRAALAASHLPWMNAARRRVGDADREQRALVVASGWLHRRGSVYLHRPRERGRAGEGGAPTGIRVRVGLDFADRVVMKRVAGAGR